MQVPTQRLQTILQNLLAVHALAWQCAAFHSDETSQGYKRRLISAIVFTSKAPAIAVRATRGALQSAFSDKDAYPPLLRRHRHLCATPLDQENFAVIRICERRSCTRRCRSLLQSQKARYY